MNPREEAIPEQTDRVALAVTDADRVAGDFNAIFATEVVGDTRDDVAVARRVTLQWGRDQVELFEPLGDGPVAQFLKQGRSGLFAGGFALADPAGLASHVEERGIKVHEQGPDRFLILPEDCRGTGIILSRTEERAQAIDAWICRRGTDWPHRGDVFLLWYSPRTGVERQSVLDPGG